MSGVTFRVRVLSHFLDTQIEDRGQCADELSHDYQGNELDRGKRQARYYYKKKDGDNHTNMLGGGEWK